MKRILSLILTVALVLSLGLLAGCKQTGETIVVGYTLVEPLNYKDENGELVGFDTELAKEVFTNLGYNVIFKEIEWSAKYTDLASGTIDCIWNGFTANTTDDDGVARADKVDFTYNYMINEQAVIVKADSGIATAEDLKGKLGVAEAGSAGESYAKGFEGAEYKDFTKQTDCLFEVNAGTADFAVVDSQLAKNYVGKGDYASLMMIDSLKSDLEYYAIGFEKGSELTAKVNAELEKLASDGTIMKLAEKYGVENTVIVDFAEQK